MIDSSSSLSRYWSAASGFMMVSILIWKSIVVSWCFCATLQRLCCDRYCRFYANISNIRIGIDLPNVQLATQSTLHVSMTFASCFGCHTRLKSFKHSHAAMRCCRHSYSHPAGVWFAFICRVDPICLGNLLVCLPFSRMIHDGNFQRTTRIIMKNGSLQSVPSQSLHSQRSVPTWMETLLRRANGFSTHPLRQTRIQCQWVRCRQIPRSSKPWQPFFGSRIMLVIVLGKKT